MGNSITVEWKRVWGFGNVDGGYTVKEGEVVFGGRMCEECKEEIGLGQGVARVEEDDGYVVWMHVRCLPKEVMGIRALTLRMQEG